MKLKCICGKTAEPVEGIEYKGLRFSGWRCDNCGEEMIDPGQLNIYLKYNKLQKEGKLKVKTRKIGNSFVISIPKVLKDLLKLEEGDEVQFEITKKGMIVKV